MLSPAIQRRSLLHRGFAILWLTAIGTNVSQFDPQAGLIQGLVIVTGAAYVVLFMREQIARALIEADVLLPALCLFLPVLLMLASDRGFERGDYTTQVGAALVFGIAAVLALRSELRGAIVIAAYAIVVIGVAVNLYELLVHNNLWSIAPGRSAGFYVNPNISGQALLGFGLVVLCARASRLRPSDWILIALILVGVFTTFSRTAIVASTLLLMSIVALRVERGQALSLIIGALTIPLAAYGLLIYALDHLDLSPDASLRIHSLLDSFGLGDYDSDRGDTASAALELVEANPILGTGVRTTYEMIEGPHNMFIGVLVDFGAVGLLAYLAFIARLTWLGVHARHTPLLLFVGWLVLFSLASHTVLGDAATLPLFGFAVAQAAIAQRALQRWPLYGGLAR